MGREKRLTEWNTMSEIDRAGTTFLKQTNPYQIYFYYIGGLWEGLQL